METLTTTSILALFETNKEQRASFVNDVVNQIEEGNISPLKIHLQLKAMEDIITQLTSLDEKKNRNFALALRYRQLLLEEAGKNGKKFELYNAKFEIKETGTSYDYSCCNDPALEKLKAAAEDAKKKLKEREDFLKLAPSDGTSLVDQESGEVITIFPPAKSSTTSVTVSLK